MNFTGKNLFAAVLMGSMLLGAGSVAFAAQGDGGQRAYQMRPYAPQLTPDQQAQAKRIFEETLAQTGQARQTLNAKRAQLDQELASPNPDGGRIETLSREIGELRGQLLAARAQARSRLAQQGLPPDCMGPWNCGMGRMMMDDYGWDRRYHHGRGHGHGGWGGRHRTWQDYGMGMGMMGGSW